MNLGAPLSASLAIHGAALAMLAGAPYVAPSVPRPLEVGFQRAPAAAATDLVSVMARPAAPQPRRPDAVRALPAAAAFASVLTTEATGGAAPSAAAGDARPATPAAVPESPPQYDAGYLDNPAPDYPAAARRRRVEGLVLLDVMVDADGRPTTVGVAASSGAAELDRAALDAVRAWRFAPARRGSESVAGRVRVPLRFRLDS